MKKLYFNPSTLMGEFIGNSSSLVLEVLNTFNMSKVVPVEIGERHKVNDDFMPLYYKDIFREEPYKEFLYNEETLEDTGNPIIEIVQKSNAKGELLYLEAIYNDQGDIIDYSETTNMLSPTGEINKPSTEERHKTSLGGYPLYYKPVYKDAVKLIYVRTDEVTEVTDNPVMEKVYESVTYQLNENIDKFSIEEVLTEKLQTELEASQFDCMFYEKFLTPDNIDFENSVCSHGVGVIHIPSGESVVLKPITLLCNSDTFELLSDLPEGVKVYTNTKLTRDGKVSLARLSNVLRIKITNTNPDPVIIHSIHIGYKEVVDNVTA